MKYIKPTSHRSREKLHRLYPKTNEYFVWSTGEHCNNIPDNLYKKALSIRGITTFCSKNKEINECWH
jgi:hypothetical protein